MPIRTAHAVWNGALQSGQGEVRTESAALNAPYSFATRFENDKGSNPEELLGAAHASCFSMALAAAITQAGHIPQKVSTIDKVHVEKVGDGFAITQIEIFTDAVVPGLTLEKFQELAKKTKETCPVSKALSTVSFTMSAILLDADDV